MTDAGPRRDGGIWAQFFVASGTRMSGFAVAPKGLFGGTRPRVYGGSLAMRPASMAKPIW
jgi:hypothetical protein